MLKLVEDASPVIGTSAACAALAMPRATVYRRRRANNTPASKRARPVSTRAMSPDEVQRVIATLNRDEYADLAVPQVYARLLDQGIYLCSPRTMYRRLAAQQQVRERRNQLRHPIYKKPELLATAPNQVWSWDITKLLGPQKWTYYHLYVLLDIFSRYVVGWMLASRESATLAKRLIDEACERQRIQPGQLAIHSDRGPAMKSKSVALLYADLGITRSLSRPHVSNDNPFSEAQFKTLKYRPTFPDRFGSLEDGRAHCGPLLDWYNHDHRHSGLAMMTPADVHYGRVDDVLVVRDAALAIAYAEHPERFVHRPPVASRPPQAAWINPPVQRVSNSPVPLQPSLAAAH